MAIPTTSGLAGSQPSAEPGISRSQPSIMSCFNKDEEVSTFCTMPLALLPSATTPRSYSSKTIEIAKA